MTDPDTSELGPRALYEREVAWAKKHQDVYHQRPALPDAERSAALSEYIDSTMRSFSLESRAIPARPRKGWMGLMCRGLGDLPDVKRPTLEEFPDARRYRLLPYLTLLIPFTCAYVALVVLPQALMSPITATGRAVGGEEGQAIAGTLVIYLILAVVVGFFLWVGPRRFRRALFDAALQEELWFRFSSERWSTGRRVRSCAQFGVAHLANLFVAIITLGGLALVGGVFMWVYLREYRETGDARRATVASARFHAAYNEGAIVLIFLVGVMFAMSSTLS